MRASKNLSNPNILAQEIVEDLEATLERFHEIVVGMEKPWHETENHRLKGGGFLSV